MFIPVIILLVFASLVVSAFLIALVFKYILDDYDREYRQLWSEDFGILKSQEERVVMKDLPKGAVLQSDDGLQLIFQKVVGGRCIFFPKGIDVGFTVSYPGHLVVRKVGEHYAF